MRIWVSLSAEKNGITWSALPLALLIFVGLVASCSSSKQEVAPSRLIEFSRQMDLVIEEVERTGQFDREAWSFVLRVINDGDPGIEPLAFAVMLLGLEVEPALRPGFLAVVESKALSSIESDRTYWLTMYGILLKFRRTPETDFFDLNPSYLHETRVRKRRRLDQSARRFAEERLREDDIGMKLHALGVLSSAADIGGQSRDWAVALVDEEIAQSEGTFVDSG